MAEKNIAAFSKDVEQNSGYQYTTHSHLSSELANERLTRIVREAVDLRGKSVLDVGCGDGSYTLDFLKSDPKSVLGVDASDAAVRCAQGRIPKSEKRLSFRTVNIYDLKTLGQTYDVAIVRGVLHHLDNVQKAIEILPTVAREIIIIEPNGYNPVLKLIEKFSAYHVEHEEKSYPPFRLDQWFSKFGGTVAESNFKGLVPFFCPDWMARVLRFVEPAVERVPLLRQVGCAVYVQKIVSTHPDVLAAPRSKAA